jgi:hypothetical protein
MGYRDDFYIKENIIGYTGELYENPTVYFLKKHPNGKYEFGHITQDHQLYDNIGREKVKYSSTYWVGNMSFDKLGLEASSVEATRGKIFHQSRSLITKVYNPSAQVNTLASVISKFQNCKLMYYHCI